MSTDYEEYYKSQGPDALGPPSRFVTDFFHALGDKAHLVLDVGCGQGRDALFIARLGHKVHGIDISPTGIAQMLQAAQAESLAITAEVASIDNWQSDQKYDVILLDRILHMLPGDTRLSAMANVMNALATGGQVVVVDEAPNLPEVIVAAQIAHPGVSAVRQVKGNAILG